jgi:ubiquinone/menaquinone biosynthesis C-methylase UbiE
MNENDLQTIISNEVKLRYIEPHIYSLYSDNEETNEYDRTGAAGFYDFVLCNRVYNRLVWGYPPKDYTQLCQRALNSSADGWVLDAGCGSLAFTAKAYLDYSKRPIVFLDQSINLIKRAKSRLIKLNGNVPDNMIFLHGDALELPFKPKSFDTIISINLLHVLEDIEKILNQLNRVLADGGTISFTSLVLNNRLADRYFQAIASTGAAIPRTTEQLISFFDNANMPVEYNLKGNMAYIQYI